MLIPENILAADPRRACQMVKRECSAKVSRKWLGRRIASSRIRVTRYLWFHLSAKKHWKKKVIVKHLKS